MQEKKSDAAQNKAQLPPWESLISHCRKEKSSRCLFFSAMRYKAFPRDSVLHPLVFPQHKSSPSMSVQGVISLQEKKSHRILMH
jgi:hypothetical protein